MSALLVDSETSYGANIVQRPGNDGNGCVLTIVWRDGELAVERIVPWVG